MEENKDKVPEAQAPIQEQKAAEPESAQDVNWKQFRESRERDRRDKEQAEQLAAKRQQEVEALKAAMEAVVNKPAPRQYDNDPQEESEDDRIQKKIDAALERDRTKRRDEDRIREQQEFPQRLTQAYADFNQVCNSENLDYLEYQYPEVAAPFKHMPDGFDKWSAIYKAVKRFVPNTNSKKEVAKVDKNLGKPQSMAVPGTTSTTDSAPMMMDDKRRQANWERMQRVMRGQK